MLGFSRLNLNIATNSHNRVNTQFGDLAVVAQFGRATHC